MLVLTKYGANISHILIDKCITCPNFYIQIDKYIYRGELLGIIWCKYNNNKIIVQSYLIDIYYWRKSNYLWCESLNNFDYVTL